MVYFILIGLHQGIDHLLQMGRYDTIEQTFRYVSLQTDAIFFGVISCAVKQG